MSFSRQTDSDAGITIIGEFFTTFVVSAAKDLLRQWNVVIWLSPSVFYHIQGVRARGI
jgi:hypothetical protein